MTEQHEGCLAVGQLAQSLKERFRLKAGAAEGRAKQNELPGGKRLLSKFVLGPPSVVSSHLPVTYIILLLGTKWDKHQLQVSMARSTAGCHCTGDHHPRRNNWRKNMVFQCVSSIHILKIYIYIYM